MTRFINFTLESTVLLAIFMVIYMMIFRQLKWFSFNRIYLLLGLVLSMTLPLIDLYKISALDPIIINVGNDFSTLNIENQRKDFINGINTASNLSFFWILYGVISVLFAALLCYNLFKLHKIASFHRQSDGLQVNIETKAFSFLHFIYINKELKNDPGYRLIYEHESAHAKQLHTLDILLLELLKVIFWVNPILWIYKGCIVENHEFLADRWVITRNPDQVNQYKHQILSLQIGSVMMPMANNFKLFSNYKTRLNMLTKTKLSIFKRGLCFICFGFTLTVLVACESFLDKKNGIEAQVFDLTKLDKSPTFDGTTEGFYKQLQQTIKYPIEARSNQVEGTYFVSFTVTNAAKIGDIEISKETSQSKANLQEVVVVGYSTQATGNEIEAGEKALMESIYEAVKNIKNIVPGEISGNNVDARMVLPLTFKLG